MIDTGADITIMGRELFKKIAKAAKLKKKNFKQPDRTPCTYDRKQFKLHGKMDLEISFDGKMLVTPIYIKMDAHDQLLLSEGVCSQLGILEYHKNVWPGRELVTDVTSSETAVTSGETAITLVRHRLRYIFCGLAHFSLFHSHSVRRCKSFDNIITPLTLNMTFLIQACT